MAKYVIVLVSNGNLGNKEYRSRLRELWRLAAKFGFTPHGYSSVFVGPDDLSLEMFLIFLESMNLKYYVEKVA